MLFKEISDFAFQSFGELNYNVKVCFAQTATGKIALLFQKLSCSPLDHFSISCSRSFARLCLVRFLRKDSDNGQKRARVLNKRTRAFALLCRVILGSCAFPIQE